MLTLKIKTDNAAFEDRAAELARILRSAADEIACGDSCGSLLDVNGNVVGHFSITGRK